MNFQVGDLFVYSSNGTTNILLLTKIEYETLHLEFLDEEGEYIDILYNAKIITNNFLKNGCWKYLPVVK